MKIILINPSVKKSFKPIIPIGLLYLAYALDKEGYNCEIIDLNFISMNAFENGIKLYSPDYIGISIRNVAETIEYNSLHIEMEDCINTAKKYSQIILGGAGFSIFPKTLMNYYGANYGIIGPGEKAICNIVKENNKIDNGSVICENENSFISSNLTSVMKNYWNKYGKYHRFCKNSIPVQTTRGCKFNCRYCTYKIISGCKIQQRPVELVIEEIKQLMILTGKNDFYFVDSVFNMDLSYSKNLLQTIIDNNIRITWKCCLNPNNFDDELIDLMKKSGCNYCDIGVDSFSDMQLSALGKCFNSNQAIELIHCIVKHEITCHISLILGGYILFY